MISVIIPTHNRSRLLKRAIDSIINQTFQEFEIIIVSDGSTDDTDKVVEDYMKRDKRIKYISYKYPKGGNVARNMGIEASKKEYVAFLDDDDEWLPDKLEKQMKIFYSNNEIGLVYTGVNLIYVKEDTSYISLPEKMGDMSREILFKNYIGTTSTVIVKKDILIDVGGFDVNLGAQQDYDLWIRVCQKTKIGVVNDACIKYYNYPGSNQISQQIDKYIRAMEYLEKKYAKIYTRLSAKELRMRKSNNHLFLATKAIRNKNKKIAIQLSLKAIKNDVNIKSLSYLVLSLFNYSTLLKMRSYKQP